MVAVVVILSDWWSSDKDVEGVGPLSNMPSMDNVFVGMLQGTLPQPHHMVEVGWMGV